MLFCTFLYRPCTATRWKCLILIASFMEDVNERRRISISLSKLECGPQEISSREIRLHLPFSANWNKRDKDWKKREFILKLTFSLPLPMLKLPIMVKEGRFESLVLFWFFGFYFRMSILSWTLSFRPLIDWLIPSYTENQTKYRKNEEKASESC